MAERSYDRRRGFALITVLWVLAGASIVLLHASLTGRDAFNAARNRALATRAGWEAEGCLEIVRASIDSVLGDSTTIATTPGERWASLDKALSSMLDSTSQSSVAPSAPSVAPSPTGCRITMEAVGSRLDVNTATDTSLDLALEEVLGASKGAEVTDALVDWRDADNIARPSGAERAWYDARHRVSPRNGPLADMLEVALLRGLEDSTSLAAARTILGVEQGVISLNNASAPVLKTIPGIGDVAADAIVLANQQGHPVTDLIQFSGTLPIAAATAFRARFPDIVRLSVLEPVAWTVHARSATTQPGSVGEIEQRITRIGRRAAVVRRRSWR